jgi:hypothetical protein
MDPAQVVGTQSARVLQITMLRMALDAAREQTKEIEDPIQRAAAAQPAISAASAIAGRINLFA